MGKQKDSKVDFWLTEDGLGLIKGWARNCTYKKEIAEKMGISDTCLANWCEKYPEIDEAVKQTREIVDFMVENAVLKAALGYKTKEVKVTMGKVVKNGAEFEVLKETVTKEVPANINAAIFWLNNRKFDDWKRNRDKVVEVDPDDQQVTITIQRGNKAKVEIGDDEEENVNYKTTSNGSEIDVSVDKSDFDEDVNDSVTYTHKQLNEAESNLNDENWENEDDEDYDEWDEEDWDE